MLPFLASWACNWNLLGGFPNLTARYFGSPRRRFHTSLHLLRRTPAFPLLPQGTRWVLPMVTIICSPSNKGMPIRSKRGPPEQEPIRGPTLREKGLTAHAYTPTCRRNPIPSEASTSCHISTQFRAATRHKTDYGQATNSNMANLVQANCY